MAHKIVYVVVVSRFFFLKLTVNRRYTFLGGWVGILEFWFYDLLLSELLTFEFRLGALFGGGLLDSNGGGRGEVRESGVGLG